jgi:hypothetical protein
VSDRAFCVLVVSILSKNILLHFGNILTVWYVCCSFYFNKRPWQSGTGILLVEEADVPGKMHKLVTSQ